MYSPLGVALRGGGGGYLIKSFHSVREINVEQAWYQIPLGEEVCNIVDLW